MYESVVRRLSPEEGGYFVVSYNDLPGCIGVGDTQEEAVADAKQALEACLDALKAVDREPPAPSRPAI